MQPPENKTENKQTSRGIDLLCFALRNMQMAASLIDSGSRFVLVNDAACRFLGFDREALLSLTVPDIDTSITPDRWRSHWTELAKKGASTFEGTHKTRDGRVIPVEIDANYFEHDGKGYILSIARDISKQKRDREEALAHLRFLENLDNVNQAIHGTNDLEQMMGDVLEATLSIFDCDRAYLLYPCDPEAPSWRCPMEKTRPEYPGVRELGLDMPMDPVIAAHCGILNASDGPVKFGAGSVHPLDRKMAEFCHCRSLLAMALRPKAGKAWQFGLHQCSYPRSWTPREERLFQEIGRRMTDALTSLLTVRELRDSEEKFKGLAESAQDAIIKVGNDGCVRYWNRAAERILGWSASEMMGKDVHEMLAPDRFRDDYAKGLAEFRKTGTGPVLGKVLELSARRKDNREIPVELSISGVYLHGAWSAICIVRDITERKRMEEQILQSQKMDAIGSLAGGVAHDFNNILTAVMGYGNILKMKMAPGDPLLSSVDAILSSAERAAQLTKSLLAFGRKQLMNPAPVGLNILVRNIADILKRLIGEDIDFSTRLDASEPVVRADAGQIEQVLMNLAANARDAMPDGGALSIHTQRIDLTEDFAGAHGFGKPGTYARIEVSDTGTGMDEKTRERIFDPFFTTKEIGKGTGLGLAIAYGIVKQHDGYIIVHSEPGKGTTFRIYLPIVPPAAGEAPPAPASLPCGAGETILLVEDDDTVRNLTKSILENHGYRVISAVDGQDGIERFASHGPEIDLLILDVIMPRKSGKEVYNAVKAVRPDMDVLFTSGYPADMIDRKGVLDIQSRLLMKPVSPTVLLRTIREILDRKK